MVIQETAIIWNPGDQAARVEIMIYFTHREPAGPYEVTVPAQRTKHISFIELNDPEPIPKDTDFTSVIESDVPVIVQHSRLDSQQEETALVNTMASPSPDS